MNRRQFIKASVPLLLSGGASWAADIPQDIRITRILHFKDQLQRPKIMGKNAYGDKNTDVYTEDLVLLETNSGHRGIGNFRMAKMESFKNVLGKSPLDLWDEKGRSFERAGGGGTAALWDLAGQILQKPVYELLGGKDPGPVGVYDGSIYFVDLMPQYPSENLWKTQLHREFEIVGDKEFGHRNFKVKIGRNNKYMKGEPGFRRDVEIIRFLRESFGDTYGIGVDANNGYDLAMAKRFVDETSDCDLLFVEEMFRDNVEELRALGEHLQKTAPETLRGDGESWRFWEEANPFLDVVEIFQADIHRLGIEGIMREAALVAPSGGRVAPHCFASHLGFFTSLQVGAAIDNYYMAEQDVAYSRIIDSANYAVKNGLARVPDAPGLGLEIVDSALAEIEPLADLRL